MCANMGKLMYTRHAADDRIVFNDHVTGQITAIGQDSVVFQPAVVGDVTVGHDEVMVTDHGYTDIFPCGTVYGDKFPDIVKITDDYLCFFAGEFEVLRN